MHTCTECISRFDVLNTRVEIERGSTYTGKTLEPVALLGVLKAEPPHTVLPNAWWHPTLNCVRAAQWWLADIRLSFPLRGKFTRSTQNFTQI